MSKEEIQVKITDLEQKIESDSKLLEKAEEDEDFDEAERLAESIEESKEEIESLKT